jgi:ergothioneine biosynthesis protein EgtB
MAAAMAPAETPAGSGLLARFESVRRRTEEVFSRLSAEAFWERPLPLRHPICFYRGHLAAFDVNTLVKRAMGRPGIDEGFEQLFERGIDPSDEDSARRASIDRWPPRAQIELYVAEADRRTRDCLAAVEDGIGGTIGRDAAWTCLEHQEMHQETLLYIVRLLPHGEKVAPEGYAPAFAGEAPQGEWIAIPAGPATLGAARGEIPFGWDNEFPERRVEVPAFEIQRDDVTNAEFLAFVDDGGYSRRSLWTAADWEWRGEAGRTHPLFWERQAGRWSWKGMFADVPLPRAWPVYVSLAEARAFASWSEARLPTEEEYHRAAFGAPDGRQRKFPWGDAAPAAEHGNFDFRSWDPVAVGSFAGGASAFGVRDLVGNGWEWTASPFAPFPGFEPMATYPRYSADFFDGDHFVIKGASPVTPAGLVRRSFRNWFQARYPYLFAAFRCVRPAR